MAAVALSPGEVREEPLVPAKSEAEWEENLNIHLICPDCRETPPNIIEEFSSGDLVCDSCGMVLTSHVVDTRSEWRTFSNDDQGNDDPSRVGAAENPFLQGSQLETNIAFGSGDNRSRELHRAQNRSTENKVNQNLRKAYASITAFTGSLQLTTVITDTAKQYFKMAEESKSFKGKSQEAILAGCIIIACRQHNVSRSFKEICNLTRVPKKDLGKTFKQLNQFLTREVKKQTIAGGVTALNAEYDAASSTSPDELCDRFCNYLSLGRQVSLVARELAKRILQVGSLDGRSPLTVAAATIFFASNLMGEPKTAKEIANTAGVSDGTIRNSYKFLRQDQEKLISPEWIARGGDVSRLPAVQ